MKKSLIKLDIKGIAQELDITPSYVSMILSGKRKASKYRTRIQSLIKQAAENLKAA